MSEALRMNDDERIEEIRRYKDVSLEHESLIIRIDFEEPSDQQDQQEIPLR